eukprot:gene17152-22666_t
MEVHQIKLNYKLVKKTTRYVKALGYGCWIVDSNWLNESIKSGKLLVDDLSKYEIAGTISDTIVGGPKRARVGDVQDNKFINELFIASNGSPLFSESAYPPIKLWGFVDVLDQKPWESLEQFKSYYDQDHQKSHIIIIDNELIKPIGILSLWNNEINNLTIQIENIWITPAYQGRKKAHETILIILGYLFKINYRRISVEVDSRHLIAKKLFIRCGFLLEGTLRKHKIINDRNRDTCIYSIINSDWLDVETSLKKHVGIPTIIKKEKIASIDTSIRFTPDLTNKENKFNDNNISDSHDTSSNSTTAVNKKKKKRCK